MKGKRLLFLLTSAILSAGLLTGCTALDKETDTQSSSMQEELHTEDEMDSGMSVREETEIELKFVKSTDVKNSHL